MRLVDSHVFRTEMKSGFHRQRRTRVWKRCLTSPVFSGPLCDGSTHLQLGLNPQIREFLTGSVYLQTPTCTSFRTVKRQLPPSPFFLMAIKTPSNGLRPSWSEELPCLPWSAEDTWLVRSTVSRAKIPLASVAAWALPGHLCVCIPVSPLRFLGDPMGQGSRHKN